MSTPSRAPWGGALWALVVFQLRLAFRYGDNLVWSFAFPLAMTVVLGVAFRAEEPRESAVAVVGTADSARTLVSALEQAPGLTASLHGMEEARARLRSGQAALVVIDGTPPQLLTDPTQPESRSARLLVLEELEMLQQNKPRFALPEQQVTEPGARYVDFLVPGLLAFNLFGMSFGLVAYPLAEMRGQRLLRRLAVTPVRGLSFLGSLVLTRLIYGVVELVVLLLCAKLIFRVPIYGSLATFVLLTFVGMLAFSCLALLLGSWARSQMTAGGIGSIATLVMAVIGGVFFPRTNLPEFLQPLLQALPLTALADGMREVMLQGTPLTSLGMPLLVLTLWGVGCLLATVRVFRWT